ncbi:MAG: carboxymuconolactone decarboxylase family protein [Candidatus Binatia bacterium]
MSRIPRANRDELSPDHQKIWDHIHAARSGGGGPYSMLLHVPPLAGQLASTEDYFRLNSALPDADREVIILTAARELGAHYPWTRHEVRAHKADIRPEVIEALRAKAPLEKFTGREKLLVELTRTLLHDHRLSDELFARAEKELGRQQLIEAVGLLGHYFTIGLVVNAFDVKPPEGSKTF